MKTTKEMKKEIKDYMSVKPNYDLNQTTHVSKIGTKYITLVSLCEGCRKSKISIEKFYNRYVA